MAVFRIEKTRDYTVMANHHLKSRELTLKAKGLMSVLLSLPDDWDYTLAGLARISREGVDAIREAVKELERAGYVIRNRVRNEKGQLTDTEYQRQYSGGVMWGRGLNGWHILPNRWIIERTIAWLNNSRRLSKDYEVSVVSAQAMCVIAAFRILIARF